MKPIRDIPKEKRKSVISKKKFWERLQVRKLLKEGYSEYEIRAKLNNMSHGTFWNRMNEIRMEDNETIVKNIQQAEGSFLVIDIKKLEERMGDAIKHMDAIIQDPKASHFVRIEAERLKMEVALAQLKLKVEGPRLVEEVSKPVAKMLEGHLTPLQALESLPKVKSASEEERKRLEDRLRKEKWAAQGQEEKEVQVSETKKED